MGRPRYWRHYPPLRVPGCDDWHASVLVPVGKPDPSRVPACKAVDATPRDFGKREDYTRPSPRHPIDKWSALWYCYSELRGGSLRAITFHVPLDLCPRCFRPMWRGSHTIIPTYDGPTPGPPCGPKRPKPKGAGDSDEV